MLVWGALCCALVAAIHIACALLGGDWYRVLGAGEQLAQMSEQGHWYPAVLTLLIALVFIIWSLYALSGAQMIPRLPFLRTVLCIVAAIFLLRGLAFFVIVPLFPDNNLTFWIVSSSISVLIGACYAIGTARVWSSLGYQGKFCD